MSICPCDQLVTPELNIPAGLDALPRQIRSFPEVRRALLAAIPQQPALSQWRARNTHDLGLMLIEMWAYVSDVLNFYDERIANEEYIRTAVRRPSLRRLVEMLGYVPAPGLAATVTLAAIAEGRTPVILPAGTGFRSDAFTDPNTGARLPPQVFEIGTDTTIHPLKNDWPIGPQPDDFRTQPTPSEAAQGITPGGERSFLIFSTTGLGLSVGKFVFVNVEGHFGGGGTGGARSASQVVSVTNFTGKDGKTYAEVGFSPPVDVPSDLSTVDVIDVQVPTVFAGITPNKPHNGDPNFTTSEIYLDAVYRQIKQQDRIIAIISGQPSLATTINDVQQQLIEVPGAEATATSTDNSKPPVTTTTNVIGLAPVTKIFLSSVLDNGDANQFTFGFSFVSGGTVTAVGKTELVPDDFSRGVSITGLVEVPPDATAGSNGSSVETQEFLVADVNKNGADFDGSLVIDSTGRATLTAAHTTGFPPILTTSITAYGNLVQATRGESVIGEVLGSGDPRQSNQQFQLKKSPLTYIPANNDVGRVTTLSVFVDGVQWQEVRTFFNCGSQSPVYTVRADDNQNSIITFGDGVRGARLPSGVNNVIANYRFGSGAAAPPAGAIQQIARSVIGLRAVRSPVGAFPGKDPDTPDQLRQAAPRTALLFHRLVSLADFQGFASTYAGVLKATADFVFNEDQQQPGVIVTVIGNGPVDVNKLRTNLISIAEQSLHIDVVQAQPLEVDLILNIEVDTTKFQSDDVLAAVKAALIDPVTGPLAPAQAAIGPGQFLASPIYATVQGVPGVVSLQSASITLEIPEADVALDQNLGADHVVCVPTGDFFDFGLKGANIKTAVAASQGPDSTLRGQGC
jgi:hypothetical protein